MKPIIFTLAILSLFLSACATSSPEQTDTTAQPTQALFLSWDFTMNSLDGEQYTLSELRGQWVMLNFWATWCGPCVAEMPFLQDIANTHSEELILLGINYYESAEDVRPFVTEHRLNFPILMDPSDAMMADYSVQALPQTILIDPQGRIIWRKYGPINEDTFNEELAKFLESDAG